VSNECVDLILAAKSGNDLRACKFSAHAYYIHADEWAGLTCFGARLDQHASPATSQSEQDSGAAGFPWYLRHKVPRLWLVARRPDVPTP